MHYTTSSQRVECFSSTADRTGLEGLSSSISGSNCKVEKEVVNIDPHRKPFFVRRNLFLVDCHR